MVVPKFSQLGLSRLWGPITLCAGLRLRWGLKQTCRPRWNLPNKMSHTTCTQGNRGSSWLLVVRSQTTNLIPIPSFGHNMCFKCPNGSCKPILDIYVPRAFQWYNGSLLENVKLHSFTVFYTPRSMRCDSWAPSWPTPLQALALVASPRLGLRQWIFLLEHQIYFKTWSKFA
jgi:hypothetical protein